MKYEEFMEYIKTHLSSYFEPDTSIIIHRVLKNNNTQLDGISVLKKNQTISPTLYLNDFYEDYLGGMPLEELLEELYHNFLHPHMEFSFSIDTFKNFDLVKDKIVYRLVNYSQNETLLADIPHRKFLDLAIVYYLLIHSSESGNACIMIRNEHMEIWDIEAGILQEYAEKNTPVLLPARIQPMEDVICSFLSLNPEAEEDSPFGDGKEATFPSSMYVLTNENHLNGAAALLYKNTIRELSCTEDENFYILPSSIHEVILIPATSGLSRASLDLMVRDVNQNEVSPMERLSDHVYFYNRFTQTITM